MMGVISAQRRGRMSRNRWYVLTGAFGTGKTTVLAELERLGHTVIPEAARVVIDEGIAKGLCVQDVRKDEKKFQREVIHRKAAIELTRDNDALTFFDRGMHDTIAYLKFFGFEVEDWIKALCDAATYRKVFLLDPLPSFPTDYARIEDPSRSAQLNELLFKAYDEAGLQPIRVPVLSPEIRAQFILDNIKDDQKETADAKEALVL